MKPHRIAVAGTGYVGLSLATLLAQSSSGIPTIEEEMAKMLIRAHKALNL